MGKFTQKGIENFKDSPKRLETARKLWHYIGVDLKAFYLTMGRYDLVVIVEAPNAESAMKAALGTAMVGNVRFETLTAFPEDDYRKIISGLP